MRIDLSPTFENAIAQDNRKPRLLCEFHFSDEIRYLADHEIGLVEGLGQEYEPLIEDWGNLKDNVRIEPILGGTSLEVRQMGLTIINIGDPPFSQKFRDVNPENVKVYLYQWFEGLPVEDVTLIDILICQDPIVVSEAQSLVKIQLISPIMAQNPFIWGPNRFIEVRYPMVLGKWRTIAKSMETGATAILLYDIDQTFTGEVFLTESKGDWPTPPFNVFIDSEQVTVDAMYVSKMNITARGRQGTTARPHIRGALVCDPNANYDYSFTAGPVDGITNLLGDGETYNNPYTAFPGSDPAFVRFVGRPPWHSVEAGEPGEPILPPEESTDQYGTASESYQEIVGAPSGCSNINNAGSNVVMAFDDTVTGEIEELEYGDYDEASYPNEWFYRDGPNDEFDCTLYNQEQINGTWGGHLLPGEKVHIISRFDRDLSSQGDFTSVELSLFNLGADVDRYSGIVRVWYKIGSTTVYLTDEQITNTTSDPNDRASKVDDFIRLPIPECNSWSDLRNLEIGVEFECVTHIDNNLYSKIRVYFDIARVYVTYQPAVAETYPLQECVSHFNRDLSSLGSFVSAEVEVKLDCSNINCTLEQGIIVRTDSNPGGSSLWTRQITSTQALQTVLVYPSIGSMAQLKSTRVGVYHQVISPTAGGSRRLATTNIRSVLWKITYQPGAVDQPDEERIVYVAELTADVTAQGGENQTPARAIQKLLENVGNMSEYVDTANFDEKHALYDAAQYYFNGLIDGETRLHDALKSLIRQGSTRLAYNAGKIKLVSTFVDSLEPVVPDIETIEMARAGIVGPQAEQTTQYIFKPDMRQRSATEKRMRFDDVRNKLTLRYNPDYKLDEWLGELEVTDEESITQIGEQEETLDYPYVSNADVIADIAARYLELKGRPRAFDTFRVYFKAFPFEKNDQIFFETDFQDYYGVIGPILTINRVFGSGKSRRMNIHEVTIMATPIVAHELDILDTVLVNENYTNLPGFSIWQQISDEVQIQESVTRDVQYTIFLDIIDPVQVGETIGRLQGIQKFLNISDTVELSEAFSTQSVLPINLGLEDVVTLADALDYEQSTEIRLNLFDTIEVNDHNNQFETLTGFYGTGGYGEGGYGGSLNYFLVYFKSDYVTFGGDDVIHYN